MGRGWAPSSASAFTRCGDFGRGSHQCLKNSRANKIRPWTDRNWSARSTSFLFLTAHVLILFLMIHLSTPLDVLLILLSTGLDSMPPTSLFTTHGGGVASSQPPSALDHRQRSPSLMTRWCPPLPHATTRSSPTLRHRHHSPLWCPPPNLIHRQPLIQRGRSHMIRSHGRVFDRNFGCIFG
jgi:hypothetical protein